MGKCVLCLVVVSVFFGLPLFAEAQEDVKAFLDAYVTEKYRSNVETSLRMAGPNSANIMSALKSVPENYREGASFLAAFMPPEDLRSIPAELITEHTAYAYKAIETLPYSKNIPKEYFLHYILPYRTAQEPAENWRKFFYDELFERMKKQPDLKSAALELNRYAGEKVKFQTNPPRDQSPLETLKKGFGRCEEEAIFYIAAARSAGIPCRLVYVPWWSTCDGNHAWVEVWTEDGWHFLGACEPADKLDSAWFVEPAKRAPLVLSSEIYGVPDSASLQDVYERYDRTAIINCTSSYSKTCAVKVQVLNTDGSPAPNSIVLYSVYNYGSLRPIAGRQTDNNGIAMLNLGMGDFFVSAGSQSSFAYKIVTTEPDKTVEAALQPGPVTPPDGSFWMRYPLHQK